MYTADGENIILVKGPPRDNSLVMYDGKYGKYTVSRSKKEGKLETTIVDWSVAMEIANKYLRENRSGERK